MSWWKLRWWPGDDDPEPIADPEEAEESLPLPKPRPAPEAERPEAPPEPISPMQQAVLDSGLPAVPDAPVPAFQTNQGTVFLGSPADIARLSAADGWSANVRRGRVAYHTDREIDRLMGQEDEE